MPVAKKTMLAAAVHATKERLIALRYIIQISANLVFSYSKRELFALQSTCRSFSGNVAVFNVY